MAPRVAKLVSPASSAKIVTANRIDISFLRVEIEMGEGASFIGQSRRRAWYPYSATIAIISVPAESGSG